MIYTWQVTEGQERGEQMKKKFEKFRERHPDFPMWLSLIALLASIAMPILRKFLS